MGLVASWTTYPGSKTSNTTTVEVYINFSEDNNKYYASVYCRAKMKDGWWVQSSGLMFYSSATGHEMQGASSICGNTAAQSTHYGGTWYSSATHYYSWDKQHYNQAIGVYVDVYRSTDYANNGKVGSTSATATIGNKIYYWDINAYSPAGKQDRASATFDEYIGDTRVADNVTNENTSYNQQPYGTWVYVADIQPYYDYYELEKVYNDNRTLPQLSNGRWGHQITGSADNIYIQMRYKISTLKTNLNYTNDTPDVNWGNVQYNSTTGSTILPPTRAGYKFLGWFTARSGGIQTHDASGNYIIKAGYWEANGVFKGMSNLTLYAHWEIQNICYVKQDNKWKISTVHVKTENGWKPAIMYIKTANGWKQSIK